MRIVYQLCPIFRQPHPRNAQITRAVRFSPRLQRILRLRFVVDMQFGELRASIRECPEIRRIRNVRQIALQIGGVTFAIVGMMQEPIDIVENIRLLDAIVSVMRPEVLQRPIGDVFSAVGAICIVDIEGEALRRRTKTACHHAFRNAVNHQAHKRSLSRHIDTEHPIFFSHPRGWENRRWKHPIIQDFIRE